MPGPPARSVPDGLGVGTWLPRAAAEGVSFLVSFASELLVGDPVSWGEISRG